MIFFWDIQHFGGLETLLSISVFPPGNFPFSGHYPRKRLKAYSRVDSGFQPPRLTSGKPLHSSFSAKKLNITTVCFIFAIFAPPGFSQPSLYRFN